MPDRHTPDTSTPIPDPSGCPSGIAHRLSSGVARHSGTFLGEAHSCAKLLSPHGVTFSS